METAPKYQENSSSSSSTCSNNNNNNNNPSTPKPITRSESGNPYPTTFVQADTSSFKQVVQMLTGSSETAAKQPSSKPSSQPDPSAKPHNIPPIKSIPKKQQQSGLKLYESRRNSLKHLKINPLTPNPFLNSGFSPRQSEILSPSILDFPSLVLSPVTPLIPDPFARSGPGNHGNVAAKQAEGENLDREAEDKAIKEKGFYLHQSPSTTPREAEPRLLPLFPVTSPRVSGSSACNS